MTTPTRAPLVAVLTGCHNHGHLIGAQIRSVQSSAMPDYEHVIVLDGCTDDSQSVATAAAAEDGRITVILRRDRRGLAAALNAALAASTAPWVIKFDADDLIGPGYLAAITAAADADPCLNCVFSPARILEADGREWDYRYPDVGTRGGRADYLYAPGPAAYRRAVVEAVGGFDERLAGSEDWDFQVRADLAVGLRQLQLDRAHWTYRQHMGPRLTDTSAANVEALRRHMRSHRRATAARGWRHPLAPRPPATIRRATPHLSGASC